MRPVVTLGLVGLLAGCSEYTYKAVAPEAFAPFGSDDDPRAGLLENEPSRRPVASWTPPEDEEAQQAPPPSDAEDLPPEWATSTPEGAPETAGFPTGEDPADPPRDDEPADPDPTGDDEPGDDEPPGTDDPGDDEPVGTEDPGDDDPGDPGDDGPGEPGDDDPIDDDPIDDDPVDDDPIDDGDPVDDDYVPGRIQGHIDIDGDMGVNAKVYCDADWSETSLRIRLGDHEFVLDSLYWVLCSDEPGRDPEPMVAGFDTITGEGVGTIGDRSAEVWFLVADGGEPSEHDVLAFEIVVDGLVWASAGSGERGNLQALPPSGAP